MEKLETLDLYNEDCFNVFPLIKEKSVNLFVLDLPYNQTACKWDQDIIPLDKMWEHIKRIMKPNGIIIMFCTAKFGYRLIHSNPKWFRYDLIWKKSRKVGFLSANKMPLRQHENIYLFSDNHITHCKNGKYGTYNPQKTEGKPYKVKGGKSKNVSGSLSRGHEVISNAIENKGDRHPTSIIEHENIYLFKKEQGTYNPQKTEGKPYEKKRAGHAKEKYCYGNIDRGEEKKINKGDRHPTSIIDHENIYLFSSDIDDNDSLKDYSKKILNYIGLPKTEIKKTIKDADHFFRYSKDNFCLCVEETYNKLIEIYKIDKMEGFIKYDKLKTEKTYNPQKTEGTPYTLGKIKPKNAHLYGKQLGTDNKTENKGDRHPSSIIDHENIYLFSHANNDDLDISRNKDLRAYSQKVKDYIGKSKTEIIKDIGQTIDHFLRIKSSQFGIPTEETYNKLIELYELNKMNNFIPYETLKGMWEKEPETTYNAQKTEGKPYKTNGKGEVGIYNSKRLDGENKGDRHPSSIIDHENIYLFSHANNDDLDISRNKDLRAYAQKVKDYIGKGLKQINKDMGNRHAEHFFYIKSTQFGIPTEETYNKLIELYKLDKMNNFIPYETLKGMWEKNEDHTTYNPQKTKGKPYKTNGRKDGLTVYGSVTGDPIENKGDRHPASLIEYEGDSILIYKNPHKTIHRTQKPVELVEWLIKTYSNEEDTIMDFTMGSGTTAIACLNTNRKFIGVEKDSEIYALAQNRIIEHIDI